MHDDLQKRIQDALANPQNLGELAHADAVGTVGNSECGEMLRLWVKFKQQDGKKVIDRATFQSFGCETAIAVASLATELIRGKTAEEALSLKTEELAGELGPLPPMKIHCAQLVEGALRSALSPQAETLAKPVEAPKSGDAASTRTLLDNFHYQSEIIAAAIRNTHQLAAAAVAGAHCSTAALALYQESFKNPYTDMGEKIFGDAWDATPQ